MTHRDPLLALLDAHVARWPDDAAAVTRMQLLVRAHPDCFERTCMPGHVTGSALVVAHDHARCLLVHHKKLDRWLQAGGHADGVVHVAAVALNEAREESGIDGLAIAGAPLAVDVHTIPARKHEPQHEHHDVQFLVLAPADASPQCSAESHAVRWFGWDEVPAVATDRALLRLVQRARAVLGA